MAPGHLYETSKHAALYLRYRPTIPTSLIDIIRDYIGEKVSGRPAQAVDVGCGSGQGTQLLAPHFERVLGTDISAAQVAQAEAANTADNIAYKVSRAEVIPLGDRSTQLVMAVQACHWFVMTDFMAEVRRVMSPGGALALVGYDLPVPVLHGRERQDVHECITESYVKGLAGWMQPESKEVYIDGYSDARFQSPLTDHRRDDSTFCDLSGTVADLVGYCSSWSGFQKMVAAKGEQAGEDFLKQLEAKLLAVFGDGVTRDTDIVMRYRYYALLSRQEPAA